MKVSQSEIWIVFKLKSALKLSKFIIKNILLYQHLGPHESASKPPLDLFLYDYAKDPVHANKGVNLEQFKIKIRDVMIERLKKMFRKVIQT